MQKKVSRAFRITIYLLGVNQKGRKVWLEEASWDCDWYWGFGYLETYTNNNSPANSRDIESHTHFTNFSTDADNLFVLNDSHTLTESTLTDEEMAELTYLMYQFSVFRKESDRCYREDERRYKQINEEILPKIFEDIYSILTP